MFVGSGPVSDLVRTDWDKQYRHLGYVTPIGKPSILLSMLQPDLYGRVSLASATHLTRLK